MKLSIIFCFITFSLLGQTNFILIGPPGAGKGTFSTFMKNKYGYYHIGLGDIMRQHVKDNTSLGQEVKLLAAKGQVVDNSVIFNIIDERVSYCVENNIPFIIDGFPRSTTFSSTSGLVQFEFLLRLLKEKQIDDSVVFVHFRADDEICIQRVCQRLVCVNCYASFNMITRRSTQDKVCDECNAVLEVRLGDDVSNVVKRLGNYSRYIEPLLDLVKDEYTVMVIDAEKPLTDCLDMYSSLPV